jgi:hypothetical protein
LTGGQEGLEKGFDEIFEKASKDQEQKIFSFL